MTTALAWVAQSGVVQGVIIGATFAFLTAILVLNGVARTITTTINGWSALPRCGQPGNGILVRAACAKALPVVNVFEEAAYWTATVDGRGRRLTGSSNYVLTFRPGQLPPIDAFWSLTATDMTGYMVRNPAGRSSVDDRSNLVQNADRSVDIYLGQLVPAGHEQNWLPVPAGRFKLLMRAYLPRAEILAGHYHLPPIVRSS